VPGTGADTDLGVALLELLAWAADALSRLQDALADEADSDPGITLLELLAWLADALSRLQDAVADQAYLGTARGRRSPWPHRWRDNRTLGIATVAVAAYILARRRCRSPRRASRSRSTRREP
jgi:hypothetical protein